MATLLTFVFVATGFVYASFARTHPGIDGYVDALYFTVATLTTTGFGDIILPGAWGKLISIVIMITGITLFVRLAQTAVPAAQGALRLPHLRPACATTRTRCTARPAASCSTSRTTSE